MVFDNESCTPLLLSNVAAERNAAVEGMRLVRLQVPVWQRKVEAILMAAYSFLPSLLLRADGTPELPTTTVGVGQLTEVRDTWIMI